MAKYQSNGTIADTDYKDITWEGTTKGGKYCKIVLKDAINMGNIEWQFAEKDDTVAEITFTACYDSSSATPKVAPYTIEVESGVTAGANEIMLGAGIFKIGSTEVGLTRGGGKFASTREFRRINADGDRGPVKGRIVLEGEEATLTMNTIQILTNITTLYPALETVTTSSSNTI